MKKSRLYPLVLVAIMSALGTIIYMFFPEIPLVPGVSHLKVDLSDIPALVTGLTIGPVYGIFVELIKNLVHLTRTTTFGIGEIMNVIIGSFMVCSMWSFTSLAVRLLGKNKDSSLSYYASSVVTILLTIVAGWVLNAALTPVFFWLAGIPITLESVMAGVWGSTLLNAIKCAVTVLPFWPLVRILQKVSKRFC